MKRRIKSLFAILAFAFLTFGACSCGSSANEVSVVNGSNGADDSDGRGVLSIEKTDTNGNVDTYTITYTDGTTSTFTVTNGEDGEQGIQGEKGEDGHTPTIVIGENGNWFIDGADTGVSANGADGKDGRGVTSIEKTSSDGTVDTYTITYSDGSTSTFTITNGADGQDGVNGSDGSVVTIGDNGNWYIDGVDTGIRAVTNSFYSGNGNPNDNGAYGISGDTYLDIDTGTYYKHNGTSWVEMEREITTYTVTFHGSGLATYQGGDTYTVEVEEGSLLAKPTVFEVSDGNVLTSWLTPDYQAWNFYSDLVYRDLDLYAAYNETADIFSGSSTYELNGLTYTAYLGGQIAVTGAKSTLSDVVIEDNIMGYPVTMIAKSAFYFLSNLTSVTFPSSLTYIGDMAFNFCTGLTSLSLPSSLTHIGGMAFSGCSSLSSIEVEDGNSAYYSEGNCLIERSSKSVVLGCVNSVLPEGILSIGGNAFSYQYSPSSLTIPSSVTSIGSSAFEFCYSLASIEFASPSSLTSIGDYAFMAAPLESIRIPSSVTSIGPGAFCSCVNLTSVEFASSSLTSIANQTFYLCSSLTSIAIPSSVISIGASSFEECSALATVEFGSPSSLTSIGERAFYCCYPISGITIPSSVLSIGDYAFYDCFKMSLLEFKSPSSLTSIGEYCFAFCSGIPSLTIPSSLTSIGQYAFSDCVSLSSVSFEQGCSLTSIGIGAFYVCIGLTSISIPLPSAISSTMPSPSALS